MEFRFLLIEPREGKLGLPSSSPSGFPSSSPSSSSSTYPAIAVSGVRYPGPRLLPDASVAVTETGEKAPVWSVFASEVSEMTECVGKYVWLGDRGEISLLLTLRLWL